MTKFIWKENDAPILKGLYLNTKDVEFYYKNVEQWTILNIILIYLKHTDYWLTDKILKLFSKIKSLKN